MEFCSRGHRLQPNNLYTIKAAITHFNLGLPRIPGPYFEFASGPKEAAPSSGKIHGALVLPLGAIGKLSTVINPADCHLFPTARANLPALYFCLKIQTKC